jgi:hypothetical protein
VSPAPAAQVRPATFDDAEAIRGIHQRNGMDPMDAASWRARWEAYPFAQEFCDIPIGWVLQTEGGAVVGSLGNIHMLYEFGGRHLKASIATSWAVDTPFRGKAMQLMTAFYRQKGVDLLLNGSANPATSQVLTALRIPRMPIPDYGVPFFWATRPKEFARAALVRRSTPGADVLAFPAGFALHVRDVFSRSGRGSLSSPVRRLEEFDDRFDALWRNVIAGPPRLRAMRSRAALEWRFGEEVRGKRAAVLAVEKDGKLTGYAVLMRRPRTENEMDLYDVADLQAAGDDPQVLRDLLLGSIQLARKEGADAIKFLTGTPAKRVSAEALRPYTYRLPLWQLYYKAATPELSTTLASADAWDFSLFDTY